MKIWIDRFYDDFDVFSTFYKFTSSTTHNEYNPLWVTENVNILESATDKSDLFYADFDVCSTSFKFTSSTTHNEYNPLWVTKELSNSESAIHYSYLLFYDDLCL